MTNCVSKSKFKEEVFSYVFLILGSALFAVGDVMFVNPYLMAPGGTYGISNVLNTVWPWKISLYAICMDVPLLLIGTWILGPKFGFKTILSTALIFGATFVLETLWGYNPVIFDGKIVDAPIEGISMVQIPHEGGWFIPDYFLNTVVAGLIYGVAIGMIFRSGATSGGSDIISMILHKYTKISLGTLVMIVDGIITLSTLVAFGDIRLPIYSVIIIFIEGKVIDLVVDGMKSYKTMFIVTEELEAVRDYILNDLERGATAIKSNGLYSGEEKDTTIHYGAIPVRLPEDPAFPGMHEKDLRLVVVRGFGQCAMLILTTLQGDGSKEDVWRVVQGYLTRWRVEETIRFVKQSYRVEDMRSLTLTRLRNLAALVLAVAYFVMVWIGKSERREVLRTHIVEAARRIYGAPEFFYYALADGIQKLFTRFGKWNAKLDLKKVLAKPSPQLEFAFVDGGG